ncbi:MAG: hypothetical protein K6G13_06410 [Agathobacter sp.]|uniref:hypothetical protein n=1 Tax=Agathobacter sp. TaxID=2021311 RepID=UPI0025899DD0|nr:hypothetical protein [Agathobacter sp.]MCR5677650.1 hypothetical protein [Agathobacter sp.]
MDFAKAFEILENDYEIHTIMLERGKNKVSLVDGEGFKHCQATRKYNLKGLEFRNGIVVERYEVA